MVSPTTGQGRHGSSPASRAPAFDELVNTALETVGGAPNMFADVRYTSAKKDLDVALLADAARARGMRVLRLPDSMQLIGEEPERVGFFQNMSWSLTALDRIASNDKDLTKRILRRHGLPVAAGSVATTLDEARDVVRRLGLPVVVKPVAGFGGKGVTVDVHTDDDLVAAWASATDAAKRVLVEECVTSIDVRVMAVDGHAVAATLRVPAHVEGDGVSSIAQLVDRKNRIRATNPYLRHSPIELNDDVRRRFAELGMTDCSVPGRGQLVFFHYKANLGAGGDSHDVSKLIHPSIGRIAERAAACFPSARHAGIDLLVEQLDTSADDQRVVVSEVNLNNDLPMHVFPVFGESADVADDVIALYDQGAGARGQTRHPPPTAPPPAPGSVSSWSALVEALVKPALVGESPRTARTERGLDRLHLRRKLRRSGFDRVRFRKRLIFLNRQGETSVVERSGTSIFAGRLSRHPDSLRELLADARVPVCEAPAPCTVAIDALLVEGRETMYLAVCPLGVIGDGDSTVDELVAAKRAMRARHPYLRLAMGPLDESHPNHMCSNASVPAAGSWIELGRHPLIAEGAETVGFTRCPVPGLAETAQQVWELMGTPPLLSVTFAAGLDVGVSDASGYAVSAVASDPVLARFAFPWAGEQVVVYERVAQLVANGPQHSLGASEDSPGEVVD